MLSRHGARGARTQGKPRISPTSPCSLTVSLSQSTSRSPKAVFHPRLHKKLKNDPDELTSACLVFESGTTRLAHDGDSGTCRLAVKRATYCKNIYYWDRVCDKFCAGFIWRLQFTHDDVHVRACAFSPFMCEVMWVFASVSKSCLVSCPGTSVG